MDSTALTAIVLVICIIAVCSFFAIKLFIKYKKTRKIRYLVLSILLGFIAVVVFLLVLSLVIRSFMVVYGPPPAPGPNPSPPVINNVTPPNPPNIVYGPPPL